jgi:hypothetical protein
MPHPHNGNVNHHFAFVVHSINQLCETYPTKVGTSRHIALTNKQACGSYLELMMF